MTKEIPWLNGRGYESHRGGKRGMRRQKRKGEGLRKKGGLIGETGGKKGAKAKRGVGEGMTRDAEGDKEAYNNGGEGGKKKKKEKKVEQSL